MFYDKFLKMCVSVGKKPSAVALDIGIHKSTVSNWKNRGTMPTDVVLQKLADYFGVTVDELTDENENKPTPEGELTEKELQLIYRLRKLPQSRLDSLLDFLIEDEK